MNLKEIKWFFNEDGKDVEVPIEKWVWQVIYKDGSQLTQFDEVGRFHQFKEIDTPNVAIFQMIQLDQGGKRYSIDIGEQMGSPFHFYRRTLLEAGSRNQKQVVVYCFGYKIGETSLYHFILPDDRVVITTNRNIQLLSQ